MWQLTSPKRDCDDTTFDRSADTFDNPDHVAIVIHHEMLAHKSAESIVSLTASLAEHPIAGVHASLPMMTKGGMDAMTRSLAFAYAQDGIRVHTVAPGVVDTPLQRKHPKVFLHRLSPMGILSIV